MNRRQNTIRQAQTELKQIFFLDTKFERHKKQEQKTRTRTKKRDKNKNKNETKTQTRKQITKQGQNTNLEKSQKKIIG